jgi:chromosomal replication initiation ATPase DnaA
MLSVPLSGIIEVVCSAYKIEPAELGERRNRHPARSALVYLARNHTMSTNAQLTSVLGLSRAESVPNLTQRFGDRLATDARTRKKRR